MQRWLKVLAGMIVVPAMILLSACAGSGKTDSDSIKVGAVLSLSGPLASIGEEYRAAMELWLDDNPTIDGREVELIFQDDGGTEAGGADAVRSLIDRDGVSAVVGPYLSGPTTAMLPILKDADVFGVVLSALPAAADPAESPTTVQIEFHKSQEAPSAIERIESLGTSKLGMLVVDSPLGQTAVDTVQAALEDSTGSIDLVGVEKFQAGATDVTAQVRKLVNAGADVLNIQAVGVPDYTTTLKAVEELDFDGPIIGNSALAQEGFSGAVRDETLARTLASGFTQNIMADTVTAEAEKLRSAYLKKTGSDTMNSYLYNVATAYDSLTVVKAGIEGAGSTTPADILTFLDGNPVEGVKATYSFSKDNHLGLSSDQMVWGIGGTFANGLVAEAK